MLQLDCRQFQGGMDIVGTDSRDLAKLRSDLEVGPDLRLISKLAESVAEDFAPFTGLDACAGPESAVTDLNAVIDSDDSAVGSFVSGGARCHERDLKDIVDGLLNQPPSASLGRIPTSQVMRQVKSKAAAANSLVRLDVCDAVQDDFSESVVRAMTWRASQGCLALASGGD